MDAWVAEDFRKPIVGHKSRLALALHLLILSLDLAVACWAALGLDR